MYCEHIDETTKQVFGLTNKKYDGYIEVGEVEQAYNGMWYLAGYVPSKSQEVKEQEVRQVRNDYLKDFVDPLQLVLRWSDLSEEEQKFTREYRQYLLDYTKEEDWYEKNPDTYEEWLLAHHPVTNEE